MTNSKIVSLEELFIEVHHARGNFSKFEMVKETADGSDWQEIDVWSLRPGRVNDSFWSNAKILWDIIQTGAERPIDVFRVTRYSELEKDVPDTTYHPSVSSNYIDPTYVKEYFNG